MKTLKLFKVRAVPLTQGESSLRHGSDYFLSWSKGIPIAVGTQEDADLKIILKKCAVASFSNKSHPLSYKYTKGDTTFFEVSYKIGKTRDKFSFLTESA